MLQTHSADALTKEQQARMHAEAERAMEQAKLNANPPRPNATNQILVKIISVQLSNSCLAALKTNHTTKCPGYEKLTKYDTTNPSWSGKFFTKNGHDYRDGKEIKNISYYLTAKDYIICVDCKHPNLAKYQQIFIVPDMHIYTKASDKIIVNNTFYSYKSRGIDPNCQTATIEFNDFLLVDTINYLKSDCKQTSFDEKVVTIKPYIKHDITTTKEWKYQQWLKEAKKLAQTNCIKSDKC